MNIFEHLEGIFSERRGEAKRRSSKFRKYASEEEKLYTKLKEGMTNMPAFLKCIEYREED